MDRLIRDYPTLHKITIDLACNNGGINRFRPIEDYDQEVQARMDASPYTVAQLQCWEKWLATLSEDDRLTVTDGETTEMTELMAKCAEGKALNDFLDDLFEEVV